MNELGITTDWRLIDMDADAYSSFFINVSIMTMAEFLMFYNVGIFDWSLHRFCEKIKYFNLISN